jgi:hypothetical protein
MMWHWFRALSDHGVELHTFTAVFEARSATERDFVYAPAKRFS